MSISALQTGLSGLQSYQRALDSSAHNIANANTNGFQPQQVQFQEATNGGVNSSITSFSNSSGATAPSATSGTDLATELVQSLEYKAGFDFSAKIVKTADQVLGTLFNITA
ncbi:flagellar hook protein FlgE [Undibacterium sp. GrIS 1.8]|uniref:flagellar basal body protein n=1 Tax=unclassified Undibacterium TaxID=2630295 RepID=UPI003394E790